MGWKHIGEDALGDWPEAYLHDKKGYVKLRVQHNTPENYIWAKRWAGFYALVLAGLWVFIGISINSDSEKNGKPITGTAWLIFGVIALVSLFIPAFMAERRMNKHPKTGKSTAEYLIKKGTLYTPDHEKTALDQFHSAVATMHQKAVDEAKREERLLYEQSQNPRQQNQQQPVETVPEIYRKSSQIQVNAGHRGARPIGVIGFYNDPTEQWAGRAAAGVDYIVEIARTIERGGPPPAATDGPRRPEI
jgi:hypothetical protein